MATETVTTRFLHLDTSSGILLLVAAIAAINSPWSDLKRVPGVGLRYLTDRCLRGATCGSAARLWCGVFVWHWFCDLRRCRWREIDRHVDLVLKDGRKMHI